MICGLKIGDDKSIASGREIEYEKYKKEQLDLEPLDIMTFYENSMRRGSWA